MRRFAILVGLVGLACGTDGLESGERPEKPLNLSGLIAGLRQAGATVATGEEVSQPFFSVKGRILKVDGEDVQAFSYRDESSAQREAGQVSPNGSTVGTTKVGWMAPPHFHHKGLLIALYVGETASVKTALQTVLGPQFAGQ
jgi:hypothetical protein